MEEILRQWGTGSKWEGWENFVRALDRNAALVSSEEGAQTQGRLLVVKRVEKLRGGLGFGPGGLASLFARLSEMVRLFGLPSFPLPVRGLYSRLI
jgi:hypothetical protein